MTAYYQAAADERPRVRVYDTGTLSIADALTQARAQGADFIVGPLTREEVTAAADFPGVHAPLLALNFLPSERSPRRRSSTSLRSPPRTRRAWRRGACWRTTTAAASRWCPPGTGARACSPRSSRNSSPAAATWSPPGRSTRHAPITPLSITEVLRISESNARHKRLESVLGTKLQFEPRRRSDIEFIFAPAQANTERLLRPQLRFHYAGDIPDVCDLGRLRARHEGQRGSGRPDVSRHAVDSGW